jgi:hypothetical protein
LVSLLLVQEALFLPIQARRLPEAGAAQKCGSVCRTGCPAPVWRSRLEKSRKPAVRWRFLVRRLCAAQRSCSFSIVVRVCIIVIRNAVVVAVRRILIESVVFRCGAETVVRHRLAGVCAGGGAQQRKHGGGNLFCFRWMVRHFWLLGHSKRVGLSLVQRAPARLFNGLISSPFVGMLIGCDTTAITGLISNMDSFKQFLLIMDNDKSNMSKESGKKIVMDDFSTIMDRIRMATGIKNINQLAKIIEIPQSTASRKKASNEFEIEWAYLLSIQFNLSMKWILTGEGQEKTNKRAFLARIGEWIDEIAENDPRNEVWFELQFEKLFPEFKEWTQRKNSVNQYRRLADTVA